jgi:signal transduction histidine kinase
VSKLVQLLHPSHSLAAAVGWLAATLSLGMAALTVWLSNFADYGLLQARDVRMMAGVSAAAAQVDTELASRLQALRALRTVLGPAPAHAGSALALPKWNKAVDELRANRPEFEWIGLLDEVGRLFSETPAADGSPRTHASQWTRNCGKGDWYGVVQQGTLFGLCTQLVDDQGRFLATAAAHLPASWLAKVVAGVRAGLDVDHQAQVLVVDERHNILADTRTGPGAGPPDPGLGPPVSPFWTPGKVAVQRLDNDVRLVVVRARVPPDSPLHSLGLQVLLVQPTELAIWRGGLNQRRIAWMSLGLSILGAMIGFAFARRLTRRLTELSAAVKRVGTNPQARIDPPAGQDEVSELGHAFSALLDKLRREHEALTTLTLELEQRVQDRTREVERLAADSRYAAVVRERLRLARDLHDTLAQSMMAMLVEVRVLRKLHAHNPAVLAAELERAEQLAHEGLNEARDAIGQIRLNVVRDLGLGPALSGAIGRWSERTGIEISYSSDVHARRFADERAEVLFRIAEEALRNIERHAGATQIEVALADIDGAIELTVRDNGIGFDPDARYAGHYGLVGMREQAQFIGATFSIDARPGDGTTLRVRLRVGPEQSG